MTAMHYESLFEACRELFGHEIDTSREFLHYLQPSGVKSAFRRRAKETHPDTFSGNCGGGHSVLAEQFCRARTAYEVLCRFISQREESPARRNTRQAASRPRHDAKHDPATYHSGEVPQCVLQIGRFLYYRKIISFRDLLHALSWQRSARRPLGAIAREWGWMTASDVVTVISSGLPGRFGEKAVRLGILDNARLRLMLTEQKLRHRRLGQYFVERRLLTQKELDASLRELKVHNARFAGRC